MADPINDLLFTDPDPPPDPDFIALAGRVRGSDLRVSVEFKAGTFSQPPGPGTSGVGIYLDTDLNPATGGRGISNGGVDAATIGWEFLAILQGTNDNGVFRYVGPTNADVTLSGIALSTFSTDGFTMTIPLSIIGPTDVTSDDGQLALKVTTFQYVDQPGGPTSGLFDVAPNIGLPAVSVLFGDFNDDGSVTSADYHSWETTFGNTVAPGAGADGNGDGVINAADYVIWRNQYEAIQAAGTHLSSASVLVAIPEPATVWLVCVMAVLTRRMQRRADVSSFRSN
jgi:hypothetical protein